MKCHYEILGVSRQADDSEIKIAYKKLALRWHPDKNLSNPDEAKEQFQLVQQAYEILSDPHERSWYDSHRDQILHGRNSDYEDSCLDVFQYFTVSCFKGYGDDPNGFYNVYATVFDKIAVEDTEFMSKEEFCEIPKFGNSKSDYENVVGPFYAYWQSYCTKKPYTWLCPYNINEIKDRRILREIEKDMKKVVQKAKRERNEEIRNLVSFVRKRDKRVQTYKKYLEEKAILNRQKQEQNRLEQIRKRKQEIEELSKTQLNQTNLVSNYEEQLKLLEQEYTDSDDYDYDDETDCSTNDDENSLTEITGDLQLDNGDNVDENATGNDVDNDFNEFYCVACNKNFKNYKAFQNHEISKKHRDNVNKLKDKMIKEESSFNENQNSNSLSSSNDKKDENNLSCDEINEIITDDNEKITIENKSKNKKNKKLKQNLQKNVINNSNNDEENETDSISNFIQLSDREDDNNWNDNNKKSNKKQKTKKLLNQQKNVLNVNENNATGTSCNINSEKNPSSSSASSLSSKKSNAKDVKPNESTVTLDVNHICVTCKSSFDSKNKLFQHLKKTNHGVYIPKTKATTSTLVESRKNKKRK